MTGCVARMSGAAIAAMTISFIAGTALAADAAKPPANGQGKPPAEQQQVLEPISSSFMMSAPMAAATFDAEVAAQANLYVIAAARCDALKRNGVECHVAAVDIGQPQRNASGGIDLPAQIRFAVAPRPPASQAPAAVAQGGK